MIETGWVAEARGARANSRGRARRAHDVFDGYDRGGVLSEQLEDELCSELTGLWPRSRGGRGVQARRRLSESLPIVEAVPFVETRPHRDAHPVAHPVVESVVASRPGRPTLRLVHSSD